jgi:hypothetical protein
VVAKQGFDKEEWCVLRERIHRIRGTTRGCPPSCLNTAGSPIYAKRTLGICCGFAQGSRNISLRLNTALPTVSHRAVAVCTGQPYVRRVNRQYNIPAVPISGVKRRRVSLETR